MAKVNANYEAIYIMNPAIGEEGIAALNEKFKALVEANGTINQIDEWGKRRLSYPINDILDGHYMLMDFSAPATFPTELNRIFKINDGIIRSMIICKDE